MKELTLHGAKGPCRITIGDSIRNLPSYMSGGRRVLITDTKVTPLLPEDLRAWELIEIPGGEHCKSLSYVEYLYGKFLQMELDRTAEVAILGGGTVGDVSAYASATFLRGLRYGLVPSTLLAQVDASIGGKNGVNYGGYKNLVGTINQPAFVLCDPHILKTLPPHEIRNGFSEVVKHALIGDAALFSLLEEQAANALALEPDLIETVLLKSLSVKARVVEADETEKGQRAVLNFGHTLAHALESVLKLSHGEAVSIGMVFDVRLSISRKLLDKAAEARVIRLLQAFGLPTECEAKGDILLDAIRRDKKRRDEKLRLGLLTSIGQVELFDLPLKDFEDKVNDLR